MPAPADPAALPHILRLLDDDSENVRSAVCQALASFGPALRQAVERLPQPLEKERRMLLHELAQPARAAALTLDWPSWRSIREPEVRLEAALSLLSRYLSGFVHPGGLSERLDRLAEEFGRAHPRGEVHDLARFLFGAEGIHGAEQDLPDHSCVVNAVEERRGLPITLACVFILVGHRLGMDIAGCNFPGHFLAIARTGGRIFLVDCFGGGRFFEEKDFGSDGPVQIWNAMLGLEAGPEAIVARVLRNLDGVYSRTGRGREQALVRSLLATLPSDA